MIADVDDGPQGPEIGAFFDFDGTLIDGFSLGAFARHHVRSGHVVPVDLGRMLLIGMRGLTTEEDFERFFVLGMRAWAGRSEDELTELGERLWRQGVAGSLYPEAWRLVAAHRRAGHTVVLASSATRFQVEPAARAMGVEHVLVTPVEFADGLCTGRPGGPPLWRAGKAAAVREFAPSHGVDLGRSYAYSNGDEDVPFLRTVGRPRALNPGDALAREAAEQGWPVARFRSRGRGGPREMARALGAVGGTLGGFGAGLALGAVNQLLGQGSRRDAVDLGLGLAGDLGTALAGVSLDVRGAEHLVSHRPAVFLFNHQSQLDVIVLAKLLRGGFTAVAKKEAASIPGFGAAFRLADVAFVDRGNTTAAKAALEPAVERLREGISLVIAPEGTRSVTPALGPFKKGAFHVAMQAGVPIVPVVIHNAGELMWRGASTIREGTVQVTVLPPVDTADWRTDELDARVAEVRDAYLAALDQREVGAPRGSVEVTTGPTGPVHVPLEWGTTAEMDADAAAVWRTGSARSTLTLLELLDPAPDPERLAAAHEWASRMVPRMRQIVAEPALGAGAPVWAGVEDVDLEHHVTRVTLPAPGSHRQLLDAVAQFAAAPLDRSRPLWAALLVEGLQDGSAGYAVKIHHSVTDGVGAVRLMGMLHSRTAEHDPERPEPPVPPVLAAPSAVGALARLGAGVVTHPVGTVTGLVRSAARVLAPPADSAGRRAPLLAGRGGIRRVEVLEVPLADLRAGAAAAGGSPTDGFLAAVLGALREYHRHCGVDVDGGGVDGIDGIDGDPLEDGGTTVSLGLPVGLGAQDGAGGRLAGAVVRAPLTVADPADRVRAVRELVLSTGPSGPLGAGADVQVASVPGIGHPVWFAGSRITRLYPLGPLAGCAATVTMVAHDGTACVGIVLDDAAVTEPDVFVEGVRAGLAEVVALGRDVPE
ncbi:HAD-IB family hydrolase [Pseudonocardia broussonetiae]|uniref:1-acyl-sn-glycerol-3-phosphate acyltransferase n=1 Tax=Pseudonocardia broussonetiae TaxID=2736640 RepID=A0A6M6JTT8_9PSEU|nr:HAD-IB family hydrolase [Pseudonocardia broussonetiae]